MSLVLIHSERFAEHQTPPGHPERPERAEVMDAVAARWRDQRGALLPPRPATRDELLRVHDREYVRRVSETAGRAAMLDPDTYTSPESHEVALLAAGAALVAVEQVWAAPPSGEVHAALALVRPPGHHAERDRAMGFCLYNNAAVAAAHARTLGARRVAIVDYDVHHGNGTQHIFETDPHVLYVSTHQFPYYPGTGAVVEVGSGDGTGFTVNVPFEVGAVNEDYRIAFAEVIRPILHAYHPDLVIVSAGFDAHERDPLAGMRLTTPAFGAMTMELRAVAEASSSGRIVVLTEGGYDLLALGGSLQAAIDALTAPRAAVEWPDAGDAAPTRGRAAAEAARAALAPFWRI